MATEIKWADGQAITADSTIRWADGQPFVYYYEEAGGANNFANDPDVVALYRFESGALTTDSSGNGNTLLDRNTVQNDTTHYKEGSQSAYFQASNTEHFLINDSGSNLSDNFPCKNGTSNNVFSFSAWVRIEEFLSGYIHTIAAKWDSGEGDRSFYFAIDDATKAVRFQLGYNSGNSSEQKNHGSTLSARTWYHVTVCYRDSDKTYAIRVRDANGDVVGSDVETTWSNNISVKDGEFAIGSFYYNSNPYSSGRMNGQIDELVIFNRFLTAAEATRIAKGEYGASYEESVSDLFKASDSQASLLKLEFANSDSFKLSEEIVAIGKLSNSVEDHLNVYEGVHRIIGVVDPTKMKLSAIEGRSFIDFSEAGSLTPHIGKRITILDWNGKKLVGFIKQAGTGETYGTIYQSDFSSDADGFYPSSCLLQGNTDGVGGEDNWLKFTIDDSLDYHWASKGGLTPKLAYYKITYKYYIPSSNSICNDIEFWFGNGQNYRNLPTTLDAATQRVETFVPVLGETIYFALGNVNNGYYVQDSEGDDVFYVKDIVLEQLLTPSETGVTVDWAYQEEGFNYNEVNEYSYEIGGGEVSYGFPNEVVDLVTFSDLSSSAKWYIENISDLFKVSEGLSPVINFIESVSDKALFVDSSTGNLIIALSVSDAAKFIDSSIMSQGVYIYNVSDFFTLKDSSSVAGKLIVAVSEEFKLSDFTDGKKKTQFSISDIFKLSDLGVTKKLSSEDVSDFLRVIDNGESVKRAILEVSDKFKMSDYSIFMTLDDLGLVAIKLVYRGKNFLTLKERKDFTFKNRTSFFTTKKE